MTASALRSRLARWVLVIVVLALGMIVRLADLTADPPAYFTSKSQDLTTDGSFLTLYARNAIEQGSWEPLDYAPWMQFKLTVISAIGYLCYESVGVSRFSSNLPGIFLSMFGLLFCILALYRLFSRTILLFVVVAFAFSYPLVLYSRVPLAENSLLFFLGLIFYVSMKRSLDWRGIILIGLLCALAGLVAKANGFLFLVPAVVCLFADGKAAWRLAAGMVLTAVLVTTLYSLVFLPEGLSSFIFAHTVEQGGAPIGLVSPMRMIETVISFGRSRIHYLAPVESLLAWVVLTHLLVTGLPDDVRIRRVILFCVALITVWVVGIAPFNYLPMRYALPILPAFAILGGLWLESAPLARSRMQFSWGSIFGLVVLNWYASFTIAHWLFSDSMVYETVQSQVWYSLPVAIALSAGELIAIRKSIARMPQRLVTTFASVAISGIVLVFALHWGNWWLGRTHTIDEAVRDMRVVLNHGAAVGGPYGPVLADGNGLVGFPLFVSDDFSATRAVLRGYPVTHLAMLSDEWSRLVTTVPELAKASVVARYWLRDNVVVLVRVAGIFDSAATSYQMSTYETALLALERGDQTTALMLLERSMAQDRLAKSPAIAYYHARVAPETLSSLRPLVDSLVSANSSDFTVNLLAAIFYKYLHRMRPNEGFLEQAEKFKAHALQLCPQNETVVENGFSYYDPTDRVLR